VEIDTPIGFRQDVGQVNLLPSGLEKGLRMRHEKPCGRPPNFLGIGRILLILRINVHREDLPGFLNLGLEGDWGQVPRTSPILELYAFLVGFGTLATEPRQMR
jgi:hypothetical protein